MSTDESFCELDEWNPMENDYKSVEFNQYVSGPGAALDLDLQPGRQALQSSSKTDDKTKKNEPTPFLVIKNVPENMTKTAMYNICSMHGQVTSVRNNTRNGCYFVNLATVADMESVFRALEHSNYGFRVFVGKQKKNIGVCENKVDLQMSPIPPRNVGIDYENRIYRTSSKQHPRPILKENNVLNCETDPNLPLQLLADDAHSLEREGLYKVKNNEKFHYHNGRSFITMSEKTKEFIDKKHAESSGVYDASKESFVYIPDGEKKLNYISKCSQCDRSCDTVCSRCSQYYCSIDCQISDWPHHRYICGKPKHLQKTPPEKKEELLESELSVSKKLSKNDEKRKNDTNVLHFKSHSSSENCQSNIIKKPMSEFEKCKQNMPRSGNIVAITAITKTNIVFIRSKTYEDNLSYFKTIDDLQALSKKLTPLKSLPQCGLVVITKFENQFNRALVLKVNNPDMILINYMDYGNTDNVKMQDLYEAPEEFLNKPRHAMPVMLKDVPDIYMTEEVRKFMYTYLNNINVEIRYKIEDFCAKTCLFAVELIDESTQQNLNKMIIKLAKPVEPVNTDEVCSLNYIEQKLLPSGDNIEYIVMDNSLMISGCISCTIKPFAIEIEKFQKELQVYAESLPQACYAPRPDELCIAKYSVDGLWYRGRCLEAVGDGHPTILFIDYGNIAVINIENIRRYPLQFTYPLYTADCEIQGLPESCNEKLVAKLEELIPNGTTIKCQTVKVFEEDNFYSISLPHVISELKTCGLI